MYPPSTTNNVSFGAFSLQGETDSKTPARADFSVFLIDISSNKDMGLGDEAKTAWIKLRDGYRSSSKRMKSSRSVYEASFSKALEYSEQMSFLQPYMKDRPRHTNKQAEINEFMSSCENCQPQCEEETVCNEVLVKKLKKVNPDRTLTFFNSKGIREELQRDRNSLVTKAAKSLNVRNILLVDALSYQNGFLTRKLCHLATVWGLKKHEYPQVSPVVVRDQRLKDTIEAAALEDCKATGETGESQFNKFKSFHENRAFKIIETMRSTMSNFLLKLTSWVLYKLLPCFLTSVVAHPAHIDMLKKASHSGLPLIFLPLHRSHLDYILISFILVNNNIKPPLVAAGNNLRIPVFGWLLRGLGAFFIKRRMDPVQGRKDTVYRAVLHTYMMACLSAGHNMEFFIEGGRTRTGKTCMPKGGLLSVIVKAYMDGIVQDALLVPVSVNYEKLVDGNFVREQLGQPKQMETFSSAIKAIWSVLNSNYGMMRIDFNQPFSLRELVESFQRRKVKLIAAPVTSDSDRAELSAPPNSDCGVIASKKQLHTAPSSTSLYGIDVVVEEHRQLVESIARHVVYDCTRAQAIMSTNAVAFLLLTKFRQGTTLELLAEALDQFRQELDWADRDLGFTGESVDVINHAVDLLGPGLIKRERHSDGAMITPVTMLPNVIELSYYSNALLSQYVIDAVLANMLLKASYLILSLLVTASMLLKASYLILSLLVTASMLLKASYLILSLLVTASMLLKASYPRPPFSSFLFYSYSKFPLLTAIYSIFLENRNGSLPSTNETVSIGQDKLIEYSLELFDILQFEFIFSKPCQYLDSLVMEAIENLKVKEILLEPEEEQWSKRFAQHLEHEFDHSDDDEPYFRVPHYQVDSCIIVMFQVDSCIIVMFQVDSCIIVMFQVDTSSKSMSHLALSELVDTSSKSMSHLEFLHTLLRSLLDVYVVSALVITRMVDRELPERELVMEVLAEMKTQLDDGDMLYGESLCVDPIKNALKLFERWEVLGCHSEDRVKSYHLKEAFDSETEVALVLDKLNRFKFPLNK
uniref:Phospholipid/glycerol acyltransferase domain-containing protein n=1 Tax=Timema poppense TaxID=170557 RepID=A0A7R9H3P8_TIMPO|nr:unnamed protein product [Timema poppensis]